MKRFRDSFLILLPWTVLACLLFLGTRAYLYLPALSESRWQHQTSSWQNIFKPMVEILLYAIGCGVVAALAGALASSLVHAGQGNIRFLLLLPWTVLACLLFFGTRISWYLLHQFETFIQADSWQNVYKPMLPELLKGLGCGLAAALAGALVHAGRSGPED
jgi:hypothetical protein